MNVFVDSHHSDIRRCDTRVVVLELESDAFALIFLSPVRNRNRYRWVERSLITALCMGKERYCRCPQTKSGAANAHVDAEPVKRREHGVRLRGGLKTGAATDISGQPGKPWQIGRSRNSEMAMSHFKKIRPVTEKNHNQGSAQTLIITAAAFGWRYWFTMTRHRAPDRLVTSQCEYRVHRMLAVRCIMRLSWPAMRPDIVGIGAS